MGPPFLLTQRRVLGMGCIMLWGARQQSFLPLLAGKAMGSLWRAVLVPVGGVIRVCKVVQTPSINSGTVTLPALQRYGWLP